MKTNIMFLIPRNNVASFINTGAKLSRVICTSTFLFKKHKKQKTVQTTAERLKQESPLLFKAVRGSLESSKEKPLVFQAIKVSPLDLQDDHSDIYRELRLDSIRKETVFVIQPNFKWGKQRFLTKLSEHRLSEAIALINSVQSWSVHSSSIESVHNNNPKLFFGSGKVMELSETIREIINNYGVTTVFLNTGRLSLRQIKELQSAWGCKVFDRYRVVLELFKERAKTKEAKLQVQLAEINYLKTHITSEDLHYDQQRGGGKGRFGGGETQMEKMKRTLSHAELKIKKSLAHIKTQRIQAKQERIRNKVPQVALVGYTNAGKTTLAKALSHDESMKPEDMLFATLDTTAHGGKLPSGLNLVYIDTVGFISDLPHQLVESFATTLDDVRTSDLLIHVSDCSNTEYELQKRTVEEVLERLDLPVGLLTNMIHVRNKIDKVNSVTSAVDDNSTAIDISATEYTGVEQLRNVIEAKVMKASGRTQVMVNVDQTGQELSWFYRYGTVLHTVAHDDGSLDIIAILDQANQNRFEKQFHVKLKH